MRRTANESGGPPAGEPPLDSTDAPIVSRDGAAAVAAALAAMGFRTIPVKPRGKAPTGERWQEADTLAETVPQRFSATTGPRALNVGIRLDTLLDGRHLVDVDLDHARALAIADEHLPPTACEFGRESAPRSHRIYLVDGPTEFGKWVLPPELCPVEIAPDGKETRHPTIVEHRHGYNKQTVGPGSIHKSGEVIRWDRAGAPTTVAADALLEAVRRIGEAVIEAERLAQGKPLPRLVEAPLAAPKPKPAARPSDERPADHRAMAALYCEEGADHFRGRLRARGWTELDRRGGEQEYWVRPGKDPAEGHSATLKQMPDGRWVFSCFSSSAHPFAGGSKPQVVSVFDALAILDHGGDHAAAATALFAAGLGRDLEPMRIRPKGAIVQPLGGNPPPEAPDEETAWGRVRREADALRQRRPFPIEALPEPIRSYAVELAGSMDTPPEMGGLGLLVAAAAAIGSSTVLQIKPGWQVPSILFGALVVRSGSMKSPVLRACTRWAVRQDKKARTAHDEELKTFEIASQRHKLALQEWKKAGGGGDPPAAPMPPRLTRLLVRDSTIEKAAQLLADNPRGALFAYDELSTLFGGMGQYKSGGRSADLGFWASMFEGDSYSVDRVGRGSLFVDHLGSSILGGMQPRLLARLLDEEHLAGGFEARWIYCYPPDFKDGWPEEVIGRGTQTAADEVFDALYALPVVCDPNGAPEPRTLYLDEPSVERMIGFVNDNGEARFSEHDDDHRAALAKAKGLVGRIAIVLHELKVAAGGAGAPAHRHYVELATLEAAIVLVEWFGEERARLFSSSTSKAPVDHRAALLRFVASRPTGTTTAAEVARSGPRKYRQDSDAAELALRALAKAGLGLWQEQPTSPRGGRPTSRFVLSEEYRGGFFGSISTPADSSAA